MKDKKEEIKAYGNNVLMWLGIILFVSGLIMHDKYLFLGGAGLFVFMALFGE